MPRPSPAANGGLVAGSGNLVHNLHTYARGKHQAEPCDPALQFGQKARERLLAGYHGPLMAYETLDSNAKPSISTPEHYLPLLYVIALYGEGEEFMFPVEGVDGGSISMPTVQAG
jgi:4,5-DOPA dioxygenase extradiol